MIKCERGRTNLQKMQQKTETNILYYGECLCLRQWKHLYSWWKNYPENLHSIKNARKALTMKQMFDISEKLITEQSDEIYGLHTINSVDSSWKHWFGWWWSHQSLARNVLRIFRSCARPWKDEWEPTIKYCLGGQVDVVQEFTKIQNFGQLMENQLNSNGIFPRIHHIAVLLQSPRVHVKYERTTRRFQWDGLSSCRCSTTSHGYLMTTNRNAN